MAQKTYAQTISDTEVMIKGILNNQEVLAQRQIDKAFADTLQTEVDKAIDLNNEQEALKARLKEKTEQLDATMSALTKKTGEARKIIKLDMPQSSWREFGIGDKR